MTRIIRLIRLRLGSDLISTWYGSQAPSRGVYAHEDRVYAHEDGVYAESYLKTISNITYISLSITYVNYSNLIKENISSLINLINYSLLYNRYKLRRLNYLLKSN